MKNNIIAISIITLFIVQYSFGQQTNRIKTLMLQSSGKVEVAPDKASFSISLECLDKSVLESKNCLTEKSNTLHKQLITLGVKKDDLMTMAVTMNKSFRYENGKRLFEGYKSSTSMKVTLRELNLLEEIYSALLENENLTIGGLNFTHSEMEILRNKAYVKALKNANALADALMCELPEKEKEIIKLGNVSFKSSVPQQRQNESVVRMADAEGMMAKQNVAVSTGLITVYASLLVEFEIR